MTYIVSSGTLNPTIPYLETSYYYTVNIGYKSLFGSGRAQQEELFSVVVVYKAETMWRN